MLNRIEILARWLAWHARIREKLQDCPPGRIVVISAEVSARGESRSDLGHMWVEPC